MSKGAVEPTRARRAALTLLAGLVGVGLTSGCRRAPALPEFGAIAGFKLQDQSGRAFSLEELRGKVWIAAFMFTRCPIVCPRITRQMRELQVIGKTRKLGLHFVSFSVDPENDTAPVLRQYGEKYGAEFSNWSFLTGDYETVKRTTVDGFKLALEGKADPKQDHFGILHGSHLVLVDGHAKIRGYYRSSEEASMKQLLVDGEQLLALQ